MNILEKYIKELKRRKRQRLIKHLETLCKAKVFDLYFAQDRRNEVNDNAHDEDEG